MQKGADKDKPKSRPNHCQRRVADRVLRAKIETIVEEWRKKNTYPFRNHASKRRKDPLSDQICVPIGVVDTVDQTIAFHKTQNRLQKRKEQIEAQKRLLESKRQRLEAQYEALEKELATLHPPVA